MSGHLNELLLNTYIAPGCLSKDEVYLKNVCTDKLLMPLSGPKQGLSIVEHIKHTNSNAALFKHPAIFYHGDADSLTPISRTEALYKKASSLDKTFRRLKGVYHEPHHDIERDEFLSDAYTWISQHMKNNPLGPVRTLKIGLAGLSKNKKISKYLLLGVIILYFLIAFRIKIQINPQKLLKVFNFITKIFWPLGLILN